VIQLIALVPGPVVDPRIPFQTLVEAPAAFSTYLRRESVLSEGLLPLGLPYTRSRSPLRRLAPIAWLARHARSHVGTSVRVMRQLLARILLVRVDSLSSKEGNFPLP